MRILIILSLVFMFVGCDKGMDMSIEKMVNHPDIPWTCKWAYVCSKTRRDTEEKSACEKFAIPCADALKKLDLKQFEPK